MCVKVTVIVTVHNAEETLRECMESACGQTLRELEIICVDGGSTDASPRILQEYQQRDSCIRIINDANTSYGHKINRGIQEACGEYIAILESDDRMKSDMLEQLYAIAETYHPDFVDGNYDAVYRVNGQDCLLPVQKYSDRDCYGMLMGKEGRDSLLKDSTGAIWTGLYRLEFLKKNKIRMYESPGAAYQDTSFRFLVSMLAESSFHISASVYSYRMDNDVSSIHDRKKIFAIADEYRHLGQELAQRGADAAVWTVYYKWKYAGFFWNTFRLGGEAGEQFLSFYKQELESDIEKGNLCRQHMDEEAYRNTFLLLEKEEEFREQTAMYAERGNLNVKYLKRFIGTVQDRELVLFGCGSRAKGVADVLKHANIRLKGICDNSVQVQYTEQLGYPVIPVEEAVKKYRDAVFLVPAGRYCRQMEEQLLRLGVKEGNINKCML